ncbi:hypothetical protein F5148DRAFT_382577 [Russula earlei]|uniref:Uncharacterized protein n=1 Tax=Russula earlei TaxID=71964 RepID=A0ACC0U0G5_9AGAM|nr:hypothetical protein F5148DRAFT_382577 [Russula earlei]
MVKCLPSFDLTQSELPTGIQLESKPRCASLGCLTSLSWTEPPLWKHSQSFSVHSFHHAPKNLSSPRFFSYQHTAVWQISASASQSMKRFTVKHPLPTSQAFGDTPYFVDVHLQTPGQMNAIAYVICKGGARKLGIIHLILCRVKKGKPRPLASSVEACCAGVNFMTIPRSKRRPVLILFSPFLDGKPQVAHGPTHLRTGFTIWG